MESNLFLVPSLHTLNEMAPFSLPGDAGSGAKRVKENEPLQPRERERQKPGRKLATDQPENKRVAQSREAQRAFRERRANYVKELEGKVKELTALLEARGPSAMEAALLQRVKILEAENTLLRQATFAGPFGLPPTFSNNQMIQQNTSLQGSTPPMFGMQSDILSTLAPSPTSMDLLNTSTMFMDESTLSSLLMQDDSLQQQQLLGLNNLTASPATSFSQQKVNPTESFLSFRDSTSPPGEVHELLQMGDSAPPATDSRIRARKLHKTECSKLTSENTLCSCGVHEDLVGRIENVAPPKFKEVYNALKAIPSLKNSEGSEAVDELCEMFLSTCSVGRELNPEDKEQLCAVSSGVVDAVESKNPVVLEICRLQRKLHECCTKEDKEQVHKIFSSVRS